MVLPRGTDAMNEMTLDQNEEELFTYEVSDEVLEVAGCAETGKSKHIYSVDLYCSVFLPRSLTAHPIGR
jgi:hypothetical protein